LVDVVTEMEPRMTVDAYRALLSEAKTAEVRRRLLAKAARDAEENAKAIAIAYGLRVLGAQSVSAVGRGPSGSAVELYDYDSREYQRASFAVETALPSRIGVSFQIVTVFSAEPR
jgi:hypothetical protein